MSQEKMYLQTVDQKKNYLIKEFGLTSKMMYVVDDKVLVKRAGCDRIFNKSGLLAETTHVLMSPYKDEVCVVMGMKGKVPGIDKVHHTFVTVSPDTLNSPEHKHYVEIAEYRCRLRLIFMCLDLFQFDIMPSDGFILLETKKDVDNMLNNLKMQVGETKKSNRRKKGVRADSSKKEA